MKALLRKTARGLVGATDDDHAQWSRWRRRLETMPEGEYVRIEIKRPRNGGNHRRLWALLTLVSENSDVYDTPEKALIAVKLASGHADPLVDPTTGQVLMIPRSIAYENMDEDEFRQFFDRAIDGCLAVILPTMDRATADRLMDMIIQGWS